MNDPRVDNIITAVRDLQRWAKQSTWHADRDPAVTDDHSQGYGAGSWWLNHEGRSVSLCLDSAVGAADWMQFTGGSGTGSGVSLPPDALGFLHNDGSGVLTWEDISGGGFINPTDGYVPYRVNSTTFGDSPWYRIAANQVGFGGTDVFIGSYAGDLSLGIGVNALPGTSNSGVVAIGSFAMADGGGQNTVAIGQSVIPNNPDSLEDVIVGTSAFQNDTGGAWNTGVGYGVCQTLDGGYGNVVVGHKADVSAADVVNEIVIGATIDTSLAVGHGPNTATIGNPDVAELWLGNVRIYPP